MTLPHIEPMSPGEMPTEPGWYVVGYPAAEGREPFVVHIWDAAYPDDAAPDWSISYVGYDNPRHLEDEMNKDGLFFIAHIYPDRIAARAQALSDLAAMDGETL
jgi:hypothetical protein